MLESRARSVFIRGAVAVLALRLSAAAAAGGIFAPDQVVVSLLPGGDISLINLLYGTSILAQLPGQATYLLQAPLGTDVQALVQVLEALPIVNYAELNLGLTTMDGTTGSFF